MLALSIPCPKCKAAPGEHCKTVNGHRTTVHRARLDAHIATRNAG